MLVIVIDRPCIERRRDWIPRDPQIEAHLATNHNIFYHLWFLLLCVTQISYYIFIYKYIIYFCISLLIEHFRRKQSNIIPTFISELYDFREREKIIKKKHEEKTEATRTTWKDSDISFIISPNPTTTSCMNNNNMFHLITLTKIQKKTQEGKRNNNNKDTERTSFNKANLMKEQKIFKTIFLLYGVWLYLGSIQR